MLPKLILDGLLRQSDKLPHFRSGGVSQIHHDVRVNVRDLRIADAMAFEPALIHEATSAHTLDLLENGSCTGMPLQPWVARPAPAQVFLKNPMHHGRITTLQMKRRGENDVGA